MLPIPLELLVLTATFVVLPTCVAILLRLALYGHLVYLGKRVRRLVNQENRGEQPEIVEQLERRFKEASKNLDQVNTAALIDQVYSQEKIGFFSCEQIDYFCRILPNLLLAFGLLGTFVGITMNLVALSETISQSNVSDVNILVQQLQVPLKGMGIAFITSLIALASSASLTVFNLIRNTQLAKYKLISALEDYLDNIYLPKLNGETRLDKVVKGMSDSFTDFLTRFGQTVRDAVESSLKDKVQEIFDANIKATELAEEVYSRFLDASGTLERGAVIFRDSAEAIAQSKFADKLAAASSQIENLSYSALTLNETIQVLETAIAEHRLSVQQILEVGGKINIQNQTSTEVISLTQKNQETFSEIIPKLQQGANVLLLSVENINQLQDKVTNTTDGLTDIQSELNQIVQSLNNYTEDVTLQLKVITEQQESRSEQSQAISENIDRCVDYLSQLAEASKNQPTISPPTSAYNKSSHVPLQRNNTTTTPDPNIHAEKYKRALDLCEQGKYNEAALIIDPLIQVLPKNENIRKLRGDIYLNLKQYTIAQSEYELLLTLTLDRRFIDYAEKGLAHIKKMTDVIA